MPTEYNQRPAINDLNKSDIQENTGLDEPTALVQSDTDITPGELELLDAAGTKDIGDDEEQLTKAQLDNTDEDGDVLNESIGFSGEDLDVPGAEADDDNEAIGEEDEENNSYSGASQDDNGEANA
ncbi:MAG: hypothetical protein JWP81_1321 [Ferruginibacter sp.]|nr:hypothetical protein [Ferruginibacter sp.]